MGDIMKLNHITIRRTDEDECPDNVYFNDGLETGNYIFIDIEQTAQNIGRKIIDNNDDIDDVCSEEIYAWVEMVTDGITERIKDEVWDYLERNF